MPALIQSSLEADTVSSVRRLVAHRSSLVRSQDSPCGICDKQTGNERGFSRGTSGAIAPMPHVHPFNLQQVRQPHQLPDY